MPQLLFLSLRDGAIGWDVARAEHHDALKASGLRDVDIELRMIDSSTAQIGPLDALDGVIVGGSALNITNSQYSDYQIHVHALLGDLVRSNIPVFFVCFGLSWLVDYLGGRVGNDRPEDSGPTAVTVTAAGREDELLAGLPHQFTALTGHTENPQVLPPELTLLATGPGGITQMVRYGDRVWATQFHAEMDADAMRTRMDFFYDYGYFPADDYARIVAELPAHDVSSANALIRNFARYCERAAVGKSR